MSMPGATMPLAEPIHRRAQAANAVREIAGASVVFFVVLIALRAYEIALAALAHPLPPGAVGFEVHGLRSDAALTLWTAAALGIPLLLVALWSRQVAVTAYRVGLVVLALLGVALAQYFAVTLVPLGSDLFGYSVADIRETASASKGVGLGAIAALLVFGVVTWLATGVGARWRPRRFVTPTLCVLVACSAVAPSAFALSRGAFASDAAYYFADNKIVYFLGRTRQFVAGRHRPAAPGITGYPLLHDAAYDDVLGQFLNTGAKKPNLVFVVVEGLGRDFVGPGAPYGGFTPFLDSLAGRSLYWPNFLSTSGRTFNVLPSLLASAPFGPSGFMELGSSMPRHISLVSLLNERGYLTEYFSGTAGHFDNIDVFMNREGVQRFIDQAQFGPGYQLQPGENGFSWGYGDRELVRRSLDVIGPATDTPRLDVYLTITTHEPFIAPNTAEYAARFEQRLAALAVSGARADQYRGNAGVFETLLYLDDALRDLFTAYAKRADFGRTIFFITGDHRLVPLPETSRIDRYHVPLIVYSPMLKRARTMPAVSSHLDVVPSVLALLHQDYGMSFPEKVAWLGTGLDTATAFRNVRTYAFMRTKNVLEDYLDHDWFLSGDELFRLQDSLALTPARDPAVSERLHAELDRFRALNAFVTSGDHLYPGGAADSVSASELALEDSTFNALHLQNADPETAFSVARQEAFAGRYRTARAIAKRMLRSAPQYSDVRTLLGRTYAWEHDYATARGILRDQIRRAPEDSDAYSALVDDEIWAGRPDTALAIARDALKHFPRQPDLLFGEARALEAAGKAPAALAVLDTLDTVKPNYDGAAAVRRRLTARAKR